MLTLLTKAEWTDNLQFYINFNSISLISGQCVGDKERLGQWNLFTAERLKQESNLELLNQQASA